MSPMFPFLVSPKNIRRGNFFGSNIGARWEKHRAQLVLLICKTLTLCTDINTNIYTCNFLSPTQKPYQTPPLSSPSSPPAQSIVFRVSILWTHLSKIGSFSLFLSDYFTKIVSLSRFFCPPPPYNSIGNAARSASRR